MLCVDYMAIDPTVGAQSDSNELFYSVVTFYLASSPGEN